MTAKQNRTRLLALQKQKRELLADMKEAGIKVLSCRNRLDDQTWRCNFRLSTLKDDIRREKQYLASL